MRVENVVNKNYKRNYDLKAIYEQIKGLCNQRAAVKLNLLAINLGFKSMKDLPKDCNQATVFKLCELKEIKTQLGTIKTLNPMLKIKKGKQNLNRTEALTSNWIKARIKELDLEIIELTDKIAKFNEDTEFDDSAAA
jgi:hypothetical protein